MKIYEKPAVELVSFQAEEIMNDLGNFSLEGFLGYSEVTVTSIAL